MQGILKGKESALTLPIDRRKVIFEKYRVEPEKDETMEIYEVSYFKEIFRKKELGEYIGELKEIWNKKRD